jgi:hypothetical protein
MMDDQTLPVCKPLDEILPLSSVNLDTKEFHVCIPSFLFFAGFSECFGLWALKQFNK